MVFGPCVKGCVSGEVGLLVLEFLVVRFARTSTAGALSTINSADGALTAAARISPATCSLIHQTFHTTQYTALCLLTAPAAPLHQIQAGRGADKMREGAGWVQWMTSVCMRRCADSECTSVSTACPITQAHRMAYLVKVACLRLRMTAFSLFPRLPGVP